MAAITGTGLLGQHCRPICRPRHRLSALLLPPALVVCSSLQAPCVCELRLRSPLERSLIFSRSSMTGIGVTPIGSRSEFRTRSRDHGSAILTHPCVKCMADMTPTALLRHVTIGIFVLVDVTRFLSSSLEPRLRQPDRTPLLLPGARSTGRWRFLLPRPFATTLDLGLALIIQAPSSDGAFFLRRARSSGHPAQSAENAWQPFRASVCVAGASGG